MSSSPDPIRVLCVDDHRLVREGIILIISQQPDMTVIGTAANGNEAVDCFERTRPDITLMDLQLPVMSGLEAITRIRRLDEHAKIIVLTVYTGDEDIYRALNAGAITYLLKDMVGQDLLGVIRAVYAGERPMMPDVKALLDAHARQPALSPREIQVLEMVYRGFRNKEIASRLEMQEETVRGHLKNIYVKLNVTDRTAAVNVALRRGIIHLS